MSTSCTTGSLVLDRIHRLGTHWLPAVWARQRVQRLLAASSSATLPLTREAVVKENRCRTTVNVWGDAAGSAVIDRLENRGGSG